MAGLTARDIMTSELLTIGPDASVTDAARLMAEQDVGALPVVEDGHLIGLVTEGDLIMQDVKLEYPTYIDLLGGMIMYPPAVTRFEYELKKAVSATVRDVMTSSPVTVQATAPLEDVATLLSDRSISRLPVMEGAELVGIVSKHDIVRAIAGGIG